MPKYSVLVKARVNVRVDGIEADSQKEAALKAVDHYESNAHALLSKDLSNFNRNDPDGVFRYVEASDGDWDVEALVDEEGDEEFERSEWYLIVGSDLCDVLVDNTRLRSGHVKAVESEKRMQANGTDAKKWIDEARARYEDDDVKIYNDAMVDDSPEDGTWVEARVWVPKEEDDG